MHFFVAVILSSAKSKARSSWTKKPCNRIAGIYSPSGIIPLDRARLHLGLSFIRICVSICTCVTNYNTARLSHRLVAFCSQPQSTWVPVYHRNQRTSKISFHACRVRNVCARANSAHTEEWIIYVMWRNFTGAFASAREAREIESFAFHNSKVLHGEAFVGINAIMRCGVFVETCYRQYGLRISCIRNNKNLFNMCF